MATAPDAATAPTTAPTLVSLLGEARATIVVSLRENGGRTAPELADELGVSDVAVRKHLQILQDEGFIAHETVKQPRGRPVARYELTERGRELFPHRYAELAGELLDYLADEHGRKGVTEYLRWRARRETDALAGVVTAEDLHERLAQLADALTDHGYAASVSEDGQSLKLVQEHCAIEDVARDHPEMCAYEAAAFRKVLGSDVRLNRRQTLASGHHACVCVVEPRSGTRKETVEPRSGTRKETVEPRSGTRKETVEPRSGTRKETVEPRSGTRKETVEPRSGTRSEIVEPKTPRDGEQA